MRGGSRFALSFNSSNWCRCPRHKPFHVNIPTFRVFLEIGFCSHHNFSCHGRLPSFRTQGKVSNILESFIILPLFPFLCPEAIWYTYISFHWNLAEKYNKIFTPSCWSFPYRGFKKAWYFPSQQNDVVFRLLHFGQKQFSNLVKNNWPSTVEQYRPASGSDNSSTKYFCNLEKDIFSCLNNISD